MIRRVSYLLIMALVLSAAALVIHPGRAQSRAVVATSKSITIGNIGWDEDVAVNSLVEVLLHDKYGMTVNLQLADVGPLYLGVSSGSLDAFLDTWLPKTQAIYWQRYGSKMIKLHSWYTGQANLGLAVPNYSKARSIPDLVKYKSAFGGKIVGIEPGAGEMNVVRTKVISGYNLPYTLEASSTPAMLATLQSALRSKQEIVVTLWKPHWAFTAYPIRYLTDPKHLMGGSEQLSAIVSKSLPKANPQAYRLLEKMRLSASQLGTLEVAIRHSKTPEAAARAWIKTHSALVNSWLK
jgi:glycine betaine/proline transport system substrate-binding protein